MDIELKVTEALKNDVGRGVVRLDTATRNTLKIAAGDFVEVAGKKSTGAIVWRAYAEDEGLGIVRMDGILRQNTLVSLGDKIIIRNATVSEAKKVVISPAQPIRFSAGFGDFINRRLLGRPVVKGDKIIVGVLGTTLPFFVEQTTPGGIVQITSHTNVVVKEKPSEVEKLAISSVTYEDIGGLGDQIERIREMIELPLKHPELFEKLGIEPPKGVLLHGPPGTGKTLIAKAVANETNAYFISLNGPEIMSKFYGESEENLRKMFQDAEENAPSIIFIDEIDAIAPKREEVTGEVERRVVAQLLALMDGLKGRGKLIVIGATNRPNALDSALRRPGRFDREIVIGVPNKKGRNEILQVHTRGMPIFPESEPGLIKHSLSDWNKAAAGKIERLGEVRSHIQSAKYLSEVESFIETLPRPEQEELSRILGRQMQSGDGLFDPAVITSKIDDLILKLEGEVDKRSRQLELLSTIKDGDAHSVLEGFSEEDRSDIHRTLMNSFLNELGDVTHGFVGADIEALVKEAAMNALRRMLPRINLEEEAIPPEVLEKLEVTRSDFLDALKIVDPSALREVFVEVPDISWEDVGGLPDIKETLREVVEWPIKQPKVFEEMGIKPPKGVLLYGPPGTGKTLLAKAVANETEANFISIKGPEVLSKWVGESEKAVREIFKKARQAAPCIIFFDEIDAIGSRRGEESGSKVGERMVNQILTELDGLEELYGVVVIGATNRPDLIDPGLLRPGRFDKHLLVHVPDSEARLEIFRIHTKDMPLATDVDLKGLAKKTVDWVGADIEAVCREAAMIALKETRDKGGHLHSKKVTLKHFEKALERVKPSVTREVKKFYERWERKYEVGPAEELVYLH
ncbi:ATP-dependent zinc metalloprotease FtsH [archaeon BMS3Bbin16]|nr:ATP-dependent zinc metalloprotease FtsH [archaeon BMS3Bbin16]